jgi:glycine/D-amino acid oxidase-like deaminating enzyme
MTNPPTTPEAVQRLLDRLGKTGAALDAEESKELRATLRALSAALEAEKAMHAKTMQMGEQFAADAVMWKARAEVADAERDTLKSENARLRELIGILVDPDCGEIDRRLALKDARAALQKKNKP